MTSLVGAIRSLAIAALVGACAPAASVGTAAQSNAPMTAAAPSPSTLVAPSMSPAGATTAPIPSVDIAHPVGLIAIGHSGLTGEGTGATYRPVPANSWATGSAPEVDSVYLRMVAELPETEGHVANTAAGGAPASLLASQARAALAEVPAPALAIIQTVDNDIQCDAANVADVGASLADALAIIHDASPNTKILVAGQLGRPSVSYVKGLVADHPAIKRDLTWSDDCTFYAPDGALHEAGFAKLTAAIDAYEAETGRVCATVPNCVTDGGVRRAWIDTTDMFSPDYAHLNVKGQAAEAALIWPVVASLLGV